jgi:hypothetical protein
MNKNSSFEMIRKLFSPWVILGGIGGILLMVVFLVSIFALRCP